MTITLRKTIMRGPQLERKKLKTKTHIDFMLYKV